MTKEKKDVKKNTEETLNTKNQAPESQNPESQACQKPEVNEIATLKNNLARVSADFENFRRRSQQEQLDFILFAKADVVSKMLRFLDEIDLAMKARENLDEKAQEWTKGFALIQSNMEKTFKDMGVSEIDCQGIFNPEKHEAVMQVENDKIKSGEIVDVFRKGYTLGEKVIRHAQVSVAK